MTNSIIRFIGIIRTALFGRTIFASGWDSTKRIKLLQLISNDQIEESLKEQL
jgi:hypothetical protein